MVWIPNTPVYWHLLLISNYLIMTTNKEKIILDYLIDSLELFKRNAKFNAPFVTICQSSGVGKSRFVLDCGEDLPLFMVYFVQLLTKDTLRCRHGSNHL